MSPGDEARVQQAGSLFDHPPQPESVRAFLANPANTLLIAYVAGQPAGFATGHELQRLDGEKPMLFLYEVGVTEEYRGRGIGTALVSRMARIGEERAFCEMFVLTNESNTPAMRMYRSAGGMRHPDRDIAMFEWQWP